MTIKGTSFDLIREKQELDIVLSTITGIPLSHDGMQEEPAVVKKVHRRSPGGKGDDPFNLLREKEEMEAFLSEIAMPRFAYEVRVEALKEQQPGAMQKGVVSLVADDGVSSPVEPESRDVLDREQGVADKIQKEERAEAKEVQERQTVLKDDKPAGKKPDVAGLKAEEPRKEDRRIKEKTAIAKESTKGLWGAKIRLLGLFAVFIVITQAYLWLHPDQGHHTIEWMRTHIPYVDQLLNEDKNDKNFVINKIELMNVRQRLVQNETLRNLLVIEGAVVNQADFAVAKVRVTGELYDSRGKLLAARTSYCGNILSDEALGKLQEEDLRTRSSISREDTILPKGQIPFMIVFKPMRADSVKATVVVVSAEKSSP